MVWRGAYAVNQAGVVALPFAAAGHALKNAIDNSQVFTKKLFEDKVNANNKDKIRKEVGGQYGSPNLKPDDFEPDDDNLKQYKKFKKQDGSGRYECERAESPVWKELKNFKDGYRTNGLKGSDKRFYRFDTFHKDIEVYDSKARYLGSKDPITAKPYRPGTMLKEPRFERII